MRSLLQRKSNKGYVGSTIADEEYTKLRLEGKDEKDAAKLAQQRTGVSLITGRPMKTRGF